VRLVQRLRVLARHQQLLSELVRKDFDVRYAGSILGVAWTQLYPLLLLAVYSFVFTNIFHSDIPRFPLFLFVGIAVYQFFSTAIQLATGSVLSNAQLITRVGFPRELVTLSVVLIPTVDLCASHLVLAVGAAWYGVSPAWSWLAIPALIALLTLVLAGVGLVLATAAVYLRDVRFFVEVGVLLLLFLTPVFYSESAVPDSFAWLVKLNPLATAISAYRQAFLDGTWPGPASWLTLAAAALIALWAGVEVFDRGQRGFADAL
jgi:ABC-type polysaccharide/polyol phosphate export permease